MAIHDKENGLEKLVASATFKLVIWIVTTVLSVGVAYGSLSARVTKLENDQERIFKTLENIDSKTDDLPLLKTLILKHMEQDKK